MAISKNEVEGGEQLLGAVRTIAKAAGDVLLEHFGRRDTKAHIKDVGHYVSEADVAAENVIVEKISAAYPAHSIMTEEGRNASGSSSLQWIVDPLDGTHNFLHGIPHFAVSIAVYDKDMPVCGVVLNPSTNDVYSAIRGQGAFLNRDRLQVSPAAELSEVLLATGFHYDRTTTSATLAMLDRWLHSGVHGVRRMGVAALDLCYVASGQFGGFVEHKLSPWDFAAGRLIVEEAGGKVTDLQGNVPGTGTTGIVASNRAIHDQLLASMQ